MIYLKPYTTYLLFYLKKYERFNFHFDPSVGLEKEATFIQNRMLSIEPRIEILSGEIEVR